MSRLWLACYRHVTSSVNFVPLRECVLVVNFVPPNDCVPFYFSFRQGSCALIMDIQAWNSICLMLILFLFHLAGWVSLSLLSTADAADRFWSVTELCRHFLVPKNYSDIPMPNFIPYLLVCRQNSAFRSNNGRYVCPYLSASIAGWQWVFKLS